MIFFQIGLYSWVYPGKKGDGKVRKTVSWEDFRKTENEILIPPHKELYTAGLFLSGNVMGGCSVCSFTYRYVQVSNVYMLRRVSPTLFLG